MDWMEVREYECQAENRKYQELNAAGKDDVKQERRRGACM